MQAPEMETSVSLFGLRISQALTSTLANVCTHAWTVNVAPAQSSVKTATAEAVSFRLSLTGGLAGVIHLNVQSSELEKLELKSNEDRSPDSADDRAQLLQQALVNAQGRLADQLREYGLVETKVELVEALEPPGAQLLQLEARNESAGSVSLQLYVEDTLVARLSKPAAEAFTYPVAPTSANLDLVLDVELNVTLRFGQRQLSLREVLDLASGSVVELDRQVDEPVELVLDGRVVARGEAVIIDGNYGMRITQVLQPIVAT